MSSRVMEHRLPLSGWVVQVDDVGRWRLLSSEQDADERAGIFQPPESDWQRPVGDWIPTVRIGTIEAAGTESWWLVHGEVTDRGGPTIREIGDRGVVRDLGPVWVHETPEPASGALTLRFSDHPSHVVSPSRVSRSWRGGPSARPRPNL